jgi:hypothetical protein
MIKKTMMMLLFLFAISFAASPPWHGTAVLAMMISLTLLTITYMVGQGFGIKELLILSKEEFYQVLVLGVMIVALTGTDSVFNTLSQTEELSGTEATMQDAAITSIETSLTNMSSAMDDIKGFDNSIAKEASKGMSCSILGIGYSVSGCGGFAMLATPFSLVGSILGFASGALYGALRLLEISQAYALTLLLPLGIILRTFRITRGAGGLLIAAGISTFLLLPLGILIVDKFGDAFTDSVSSLADGSPDRAYVDPVPSFDVECNPGSTLPALRAATAITGGLVSIAEMATSDNNEERAIGTYLTLRQNMKHYIFLILVKGTLGPAVALLMMVSGIRALTAIAGAEIDVSALGRFGISVQLISRIFLTPP